MASKDIKKFEGDLAVAEQKPELKSPSMYKVVLINDDYTPMEFVVALLKTFFSLDDTSATHVMWQIHTAGKGICGVYSKDVAETKVVQVNDFARSYEHPLLCEIEPA